MNRALGLFETVGLIPLLAALDAALKAANVKIASGIFRHEGGLVTVMIDGDVSSVRAAIEAGAEAASALGNLKAAHVIPRPANQVVAAFLGGPAR